MRVFKLIKEYLGSLKLGTKVSYSEKYKIYNYNGGNFYSEFPKNQIENLPEFWEEIIEKNYEILQLLCDNHNKPYVLQNNGLYSFKEDIGHISLNGALFHFPVIKSVKRLSDGEIFTIGDILKGSSGIIYPINNFKIFNGEILITAASVQGGLFNHKLNNAKKAKQPLFTTEDGVEMFKGDIYFYIITSNHNIGNKWKVLEHVVDWDNSIKPPLGGIQFLSQQKAEEYILMNKPCLSINDIITSTCFRWQTVVEEMKNKVKSKI